VVPLLTSKLLSTPHGFTTRAGGLSQGYYSSLNLGLSTAEDPNIVGENRQRVFQQLGVSKNQVCLLEQVHGNTVVVAQPSWHQFQADALVTNQKDLLLIIGVADCVPILFHDPVKQVIGAAHAGWRGTSLKIVEKVIEKMVDEYGSSPTDLRVVLGPAISRKNYQVGPEVIEAFINNGFPDTVFDPDEDRYYLDVPGANRFLLETLGVYPEHMELMSACTFTDPTMFYSHRRDGKKRGSHWAVIKLSE
jgi:polyphenol oxidase